MVMLVVGDGHLALETARGLVLRVQDAVLILFCGVLEVRDLLVESLVVLLMLGVVVVLRVRSAYLMVRRSGYEFFQKAGQRYEARKQEGGRGGEREGEEGVSERATRATRATGRLSPSA